MLMCRSDILVWGVMLAYIRVFPFYMLYSCAYSFELCSYVVHLYVTSCAVLAS